MTSLREFFSRLSPGQKRGAVLLLLIASVLAVGFTGYKYSRSAGPPAPVSEKKKDLSLEPRLMEKSLFMESQKELRRQEAGLSELRREMEELKKQKREADTNGKEAAVGDQKERFPIPPPPPPGEFRIPPPPAPSPAARPPDPQREILGEIMVVSNPHARTAKANPEEEKKKEKRSVYLPPSFMEATLLTGLDAETVESARGNPEPVLLRIKDLAVLPNRIKANLKGCFVIAHGFGRLSKERVELRLVTLSCLAKDGQAVIDQALKGYIADEDGKNGLRGEVVSRMGSSVARAALAGFFGGAGDAFRAAANTTSVSPLGTTQTVQPGNIGIAAIGGGLSGGSDQLEKLYLDLARQATPIIEIGATKTVTLVVTEGIDLIIKDVCIGGQQCVR
ncbi:TraB/VirB10 family protein [Candidatus Manganitrophus noduliformans]|uniref:Conjugal transfer protein TraB n=1 Tax=Candidatus Manganitrophus noduliformans TaxID=2606439 RepID=A0A7X6DQ68_9BACT|nr:TraB/VirB10 family protein [Candidatus Manganitrophus noduliformans]NKE71279.1 conjugal transfer protein TraB [Candidatus Manganitrophus noduliformans]